MHTNSEAESHCDL